MFRPQPFLRLGGGIAFLLSAASLCSPGTFARPQEEPPLSYTDEDLKPKRPTPPQTQPGPQEQPQGLPQFQGQPLPQGQPQPQGQPLPQAPPQAQPQTRPQGQPQSRPVAPLGAGKPAITAAPQGQPAPPAPAAPPAAPSAGAPSAGAPKWPGPDAWTQDWRKGEEDRAYWAEKERDAEDEIARLERRLDYLERKKASIQNPFLPRPLLTEEDRVAEEGLDGPARLVRADGQIADARLELERARRELDRARALGRGEAPPPRTTGQTDKTN